MGERTITDQYAAIAAGDLAKWVGENQRFANELFAQAAGEVDNGDPFVHVLTRWLDLFGRAIHSKEPDHGA